MRDAPRSLSRLVRLFLIGYREFLSSLFPSPHQDLPARLRFHPCTKPKLSDSPASTRLIGALHIRFLLRTKFRVG